MIKNGAKLFSFLFLFILAFLCCSKIMTAPGYDGYLIYQYIRGFYKEPKNSLDMVFIGGSTMFTFLEPPFIFQKYGLTSWSFTTNAQPVEIAEYLLKEARKRQPNALYIINISTIPENFYNSQIHWSLDHLPLSWNKLALTHFMVDFSEYKPNERMEFYIPILRFHSRWKNLRIEDFNYQLNGFKSGCTHGRFPKVKDVSENFIKDTKTSPLPKKIETSILSLLDYCDDNHVRVLFMISPQALKEHQKDLQRINFLKEIIIKHGYIVLDLIDTFDNIGLDLKTDFIDIWHTNIHGAIKTEDAVIRYVKEHYEFKDKRNDANFSDWNKAAADYLAFVDKYLTNDEKDYFYMPLTSE